MPNEIDALRADNEGLRRNLEAMTQERDEARRWARLWKRCAKLQWISLSMIRSLTAKLRWGSRDWRINLRFEEDVYKRHETT